MFGVAEPVSAFADANGADSARPVVNFLEGMAVDGKIVPDVKVSGRKRFAASNLAAVSVAVRAGDSA